MVSMVAGGAVFMAESFIYTTYDLLRWSIAWLRALSR